MRGISDLYSICRIVDNQAVSARLYEELRKTALKIFDDYYWISDPEIDNIEGALREVVATADLAIDEFEKVESIRKQSVQILNKAGEEQESLLREVRLSSWETAEDFVQA